jgi:hypothetical protein
MVKKEPFDGWDGKLINLGRLVLLALLLIKLFLMEWSSIKAQGLL